MRLSSSAVPLALLIAYVPLSVFYSFSAIQAVVFLLGLFALRTVVSEKQETVAGRLVSYLRIPILD
jgi:hypothetical protein